MGSIDLIQHSVEFIGIDRTLAALDTLLTHFVHGFEGGPEIHPILGKILAHLGEFLVPGGVACFDPARCVSISARRLSNCVWCMIGSFSLTPVAGCAGRTYVTDRSEVQCAQRAALIGMVDRQYGHSFVVGSAGAASSF